MTLIEYVPLKKFSHADSLSRLMPKYYELLEDTVIVAFKDERELKEVVVNSMRITCDSRRNKSQVRNR